MISQTTLGAQYFIRGLKLIFAPGIRRYTAIPLLINLIVFAMILLYGVRQFTYFTAWLMTFLPSWMDWISWVLWPLFAILALLIIFYTFSILANLISAPFNGLLATAVERHLTGQSNQRYQDDISTAVQDFMPALTNELRKLIYFLLWAIPLGILFLIPVVNVFAPLLWLVFSAWMLAFEYGDFPMGNHGLNFGKQRSLLRGQRLTSLGFGATVLVATLTPVANFLVIPAAVAGSTVFWVERLQTQVKPDRPPEPV